VVERQAMKLKRRVRSREFAESAPGG